MAIRTNRHRVLHRVRPTLGKWLHVVHLEIRRPILGYERCRRGAVLTHALCVLQHPFRDLSGPLERHSRANDALWLIRTRRLLSWQLLPGHSCAQSELEPLILRGTPLLQSAKNARKPFRGNGAAARCGLVPGIAT